MTISEIVPYRVPKVYRSSGLLFNRSTGYPWKDVQAGDFPEAAKSHSLMRTPVIETMHGHTIADPHRWLEDENDPEVVAWVEGQNQATRAILDNLPQRPAIT